MSLPSRRAWRRFARSVLAIVWLSLKSGLDEREFGLVGVDVLCDVGGEAFAGAGELDHPGYVAWAGGEGAVDVAMFGVLELEDEGGAGDLVVEDAGVWVGALVGVFHEERWSLL